MQLPTRRLGPRRLDEDVRPIVGAEVVPRIGGEDARGGVDEAPVGAYIEDFAFRLLGC